MKLLSFGEILFDIFEDVEQLGGAPLNLAAHASFQGAKAFLLSGVGIDGHGGRAMADAQDLGISTDYVALVADKDTGCCRVTLDENGVPSYNLLSDVAFDYIDYYDVGEKFDILCFGTLALRSEHNLNTLKAIIQNKVCDIIYCDLNIREPYSTENAVKFCLENANIVKISDEELPFVINAVFGKKMSIDEGLKAISEAFKQIKIIILTLGANGSLALDTVSGKIYRQEAIQANVVSTVGAGDSFGATFLVRYFAGDNIEMCLEKAARVSAYVVGNEGAVPKGIKKFLKAI